MKDNSCFRFDFRGISLGCNSTDQACSFKVTGLRWNGRADLVQGGTTFSVDSCPQQSNCELRTHVVDTTTVPSFSNLTAITVEATSAGHPVEWWADDIQLGWTDNSCGAATCRQKIPNTIMKQTAWTATIGKAKSLLRWARRSDLS